MALDTYQQINELIKKSHHILITSAITDTGDGLSCALALKLFLEKMNKPADVFAPESIKNKFKFLPASEKIKTQLGSLKKLIISLDISKNKIDEFNYDISDNHLKIFVTPKNGAFNEQNISLGSSDFKYDLIFIIGSPDLESLGNLYLEHPDFFYQTSIVNIDIDAANEHYGQVNLIELNHSSIAEAVFSLLEALEPDFIDEAMATNLLAGLIIKTNGFRTSHLSPSSLMTASRLIKLGADRDSIINSLNQNKNLATLNLWGRVLARLKQDSYYHLAWSLISQTDFKKSGTTADNLSGVVSELIFNSPQIEAVLILYETEAGNIAGKFYSSLNYNSLDLTQPFKPSGHKNLAEFSLTTTRLIEAEEEVVNKIRERMGKNKAN